MTIQVRARIALLIMAIATLIIVATIVRASGMTVEIANVERASVGTGNLEGDDSSFHAYSTVDGNVVTFQSWSMNWSEDGIVLGYNWLDIFVRNRQTDTTLRYSWSHDGDANTGSINNWDAVDPIITADGRYVVYNSFASNIVPGDTNRGDDVFVLEGLDGFLVDLQNGGATQRITLNWENQQIIGDSGPNFISADSNWHIFASNGINLIPEGNNEENFYVILRDWRAGVNTVVTNGLGGNPPNGYSHQISADFDGEYIIYASESSNLIPNDNNNTQDVFLYKRLTGETILVSRGMNGGVANGLSGQPQINQSGTHVVFKSEASDLVAGDTNGVNDIYVYEIATGNIARVSMAHDGAEPNGLSRDPSVCNDGRFISYTSAASNLVPNDNNNERDIFVHDMNRGEIVLASTTSAGLQGNGQAHRSFLVPDCSGIYYASDATNVVAGDTNNRRDIFYADLLSAPDLSTSYQIAPATAVPSETIDYEITLVNSGSVDDVVSLTTTVPEMTTYVVGSASADFSYDAGTSTLSWNGNIPADGQQTFTFSVVINPAIIDPTAIWLDSDVVTSENSFTLSDATIIFGQQHYLPIIAHD